VRAAGLRSVAKGGIFLKLLSNSQMLTLARMATKESGGVDEETLIDGLFELGQDLPQLCSEIYAVALAA